jgi:hypothetical protein
VICVEAVVIGVGRGVTEHVPDPEDLNALAECELEV